MRGVPKLEELPSLVANPSDRVHGDKVTELHSGMEQRILGDRQMLQPGNFPSALKAIGREYGPHDETVREERISIID